MKRCSVCRERGRCIKVCADLEARLPKDGTGWNTHREVILDNAGLEDAAERYSYRGWRALEFAPIITLDTSRLTRKELSAVMLLARGLSQREAAARLKISRASLRARVATAKKKLLPARPADLLERDKLNQTIKEATPHER